MRVEYLRPTPIAAELRVVGSVQEAAGGRAAVACTLEADGKVRARAVVESVRVRDEWRHGAR
jgi:hypothetical protein